MRRRVWSERFEPHQWSAGEVAVRARRLRQDAVPRSTDSLRQAAAATAVSTHRLSSRHRTTVLCATRRKDAHRYADTRHAAERWIFQLAVHDRSVNVGLMQ